MKRYKFVPLCLGFCLFLWGLMPVYAARTVRVNVASNGEAATGGDSFAAAISGDGRYVVFESDAGNLVENDAGVKDIFLHDRDTDGDGIFDETNSIKTIQVNVDSNGNPATQGDSEAPDVSDDGRYVVFASDAGDLVVGDTGVKDIFVHDRDADNDGVYDEAGPGAIRTIQVNVDSDGNPATQGNSRAPVISSDGRFVAFESLAGNLVAGDTGVWDIFVHDRDADGDGIYDETDPGAIKTIQVNVDSDGNPATQGNSEMPKISNDGRYVVFASDAGNLVTGDTGVQDIFVHDRDADGDGIYDEADPGAIKTVQVNVSSQGVPASGTDSYAPEISSSGRFVTFESVANNLVPNDTSGRDIFLHDRDADEDGVFDEGGSGEIETTRANLHSDGTPATGGASLDAAISDDGDQIAFESSANNLVDGDTSGRDIFVRVTTPEPTDDDDETDDGGGSGGCFIAVSHDVAKKWLEIIAGLL